jgi:DNA invertase Pin-like site-specific DNA recombinase
MTLIGYARLSTRDQDLETQQAALTSAGCERIFSEKITGGHANRPEWVRVLDYIHEGDVVMVTRLDRLARNTGELLRLDEPWADTTSPAGKMILTVLAGVAEFERALIVTRTSEGRKAAKERGVKFGRKATLGQEQIEHARHAIESGATMAAMAEILKVHRTTLSRALKNSQD